MTITDFKKEYWRILELFFFLILLILLLTVHLDLLHGDEVETEFGEEKYPVILKVTVRSTGVHGPGYAGPAGLRS